MPTRRNTEKRSEPQAKAPLAADGRIEQLSALLHQLDSTRDDERKLLSRDLHDTLVASLSATKMECDYLLRTGAGSVTEPELKRRLMRVSASLGEAIQYARRVIDQLWPSAVDHLGLASALSNHIEELRTGAGLEVDAKLDDDLGALPEAHAMMLYRAVVEALEFCRLQTPPLRSSLRVHRTGSGIELAIGGEGEAWPKPFDGRMIRERALHLGGECEFGREDAARFQLRLFLPVRS